MKTNDSEHDVDGGPTVATQELLDAADALRKTPSIKWPILAGFGAVALSLIRVGVVLGGFESSLDGVVKTQAELVHSVDRLDSRLQRLEIQFAYVRGGLSTPLDPDEGGVK